MICQTCRGVHYVRYEGDYLLTPCPDCYPDAVLRPMSGLPEDAPRRLSDLIRYEHVAEVIDAAKQVITREPPCGFFVMHGAYGVGKSYISMAMVNVAISMCIEAHYYTAEAMMSWLRKGIGADDYEAREDLLFKTPVLAIDEFTRYRDSDWATARMMDLIGERYLERKRLLTIISYNTGELDPYFVTRFSDQDGYHVNIVGPDLRTLRA